MRKHAFKCIKHSVKRWKWRSFIIPLKWHFMCLLFVQKKVFESKCYFSQMSLESEGQQKSRSLKENFDKHVGKWSGKTWKHTLEGTEKHTLNKLKRNHKSGVSYKNTGKTNASGKAKSRGPWTPFEFRLDPHKANRAWNEKRRVPFRREVSLPDHTHTRQQAQTNTENCPDWATILMEAPWCVYGGRNKDVSKVQENTDNATPHMDTTKEVKAAR